MLKSCQSHPATHSWCIFFDFFFRLKSIFFFGKLVNPCNVRPFYYWFYTDIFTYRAVRGLKNMYGKSENLHWLCLRSITFPVTFPSRHYLWCMADPRFSFGDSFCHKAGVCCGLCSPSKWEGDIWGWLEVRRSAILHYTSTSLHGEPASALSLSTVWSHQGNLVVTRCWEMTTLPMTYMQQCKVPSASSSKSLGFIVCAVL